jgi:hypothetical protein
VRNREFGSGTKAFRAPHIGLSLGKSWQPSADTVFRVAFQGAVSFFQTDRRSTEEFGTVTWMGLAATCGYDFH